MVIKSLQAGRGIAALAVAIYHTYLILYQKTGVAQFSGAFERPVPTRSF